MESHQSLVFDLINYTDSGMYIDNPMELTLHEFGNLNVVVSHVDCHVKLAQLKVASDVVNYFCSVCVT